MDIKEQRTLKLLEEIVKEQGSSQRDLATRLNISLGLVNSFIKRLTRKGYFKITHIPKNRVRYILTPKGVAEKTRLTYAYLQMSFKYYKNARGKMNELFQQFERQKIDRILFVGAGELAEIAYMSLQETRIRLVGIVDSEKAGEKFFSFKIVAPEDITALNFQKAIITTMESTDAALDTILEAGVKRSDIVLL